MKVTFTILVLLLGLIALVAFFTELQACHEAGGQFVRGLSLTGYVCIT